MRVQRAVRATATLLVLQLSLHGRSCPQSAPPIPRVGLQAGEKVAISGLPAAGGGTGAVRCDGRGNVYMRPVLGRASGLRSPVLRISADGQNTTLFDLSNVPEIREAASYEIYDFAVSKNGKLFELAAITGKDQQPAVGIIEIEPDDNSASFLAIDVTFSPRQIAPLSGGMFLLSGVQRSSKLTNDHKIQSASPFMAIFDSRCKLVKELKLPEDVKIADLDSFRAEEPDISGLQAVDLSEFAVGDDGTVYLLRGGTTPRVYVISSSGEELRNFTVLAPASGRRTAFDDVWRRPPGIGLFRAYRQQRRSAHESVDPNR